jgi:hypothetical protein
LYRQEEHGFSVTALQVDDNLGHGTPMFLKDEEHHSSRFVCKPRQILHEGHSIHFNGAELSMHPRRILALTQSKKLQELKHAKIGGELVSIRAAMRYIATCTRPDLAAPCQLLASRVGDNAPHSVYTAMNKLVSIARETVQDGLRFVPLDLETVRVVLFSDASFSNAAEYKSQLGFVICLAEVNDNANIVHYGIAKCKRVTRSVMASELHGLVLRFDNAYFVKTMISELLNGDVPIDAFIDSKTVFDTIVKLGTTTEKRLLIDAAALQESHLKGELRSLFWIPSAENCADALTKEPYQPDSALTRLIKTNMLQVTPCGWVNRAGLNSHDPFVPIEGSCEKKVRVCADTIIPALK